MKKQNNKTQNLVSIFTFFNSVFSLPLLLHEAFISEASHWLAEPCGPHVLSPAEPHGLLLHLWSDLSWRWLDGQVLWDPLDIVKNLVQDSMHLADSCLQSRYHCYFLFINSFISRIVPMQNETLIQNLLSNNFWQVFFMNLWIFNTMYNPKQCETQYHMHQKNNSGGKKTCVYLLNSGQNLTVAVCHLCSLLKARKSSYKM